MKRKTLKIAAFLTAAALIAGLCLFAGALTGNPVSRLLAARTAKKHLADHYAGTDFALERIDYDFKGGYYYARIAAPGSPDRYFSLYLNMDGSLARDGYEDQVAGRSNTARRLDQSYRELVDTVLSSPTLPFSAGIAYGVLEFLPPGCTAGDEFPSYALKQEALELDRPYNIPALGAQAGHVVLYAEDETVTAARAAEILLEARKQLEGGGAPFYAIDFVLQYPAPDGQSPRREDRIEVRGFLCADIYAGGMTGRVQAASDRPAAYYADLDAEKTGDLQSAARQPLLFSKRPS